MYKNVFLICVTTIVAISLSSCSHNDTHTITSNSSSDIYQQNYAKATEIYKKMTLDEKIGQLILPSYGLLNDSVESDGKNCTLALNTNESSEIISKCGLDQIAKYHIGAVLTGGGPYYNAPTVDNWARLNSLATFVHNTSNPNDPILLTGNDAVHCNMHIQGGVMAPHNIGLGVTHDPQLIEQLELVCGEDSLYSGFNWVYAPTVAVVQDTRWGRSYEGFGRDPLLVKSLIEPFVRGLQNIQDNKITGALATVKHFIGVGATQYGLDEWGDSYSGSEQMFWNTNGLGYEAGVNANAGSIMSSYSYVNDVASTACPFGCAWDILNKFKNVGLTGSDGAKYKFSGFVVTDWNSPTRSSWFANNKEVPLSQIMARTINAGNDMVMVASGSLINPWDKNSGYNFTTLGEVFDATKAAINNNLISQKRLEDAVVRILEVKLAMNPLSASSINYNEVQAKEREFATKAAKESLVLLKNQKNLLPLSHTAIKNVVFVGDTDDIGLQNGGWSVTWQGQESNQYFTGIDKISSGAATLEDGIKEILKDQKVAYYHVANKGLYTSLPKDLDNTSTLVVFLVSEYPYAEMNGDVGNSHEEDGWYKYGEGNLYKPNPQSKFLGLKYSRNQILAMKQLKKSGIDTITVVYSGRPVIISGDELGSTVNAPLQDSTAVIAAFLPGTTGGTALASAIFGQYHFRSDDKSNTLTFPWPANMKQVEDQYTSGNLYPIGYGLSD